MYNRRVLSTALAVCLFTALWSAEAQAAFRTFVKSTGNDANAASPNLCSLTMPCRTLNVAFGVTDAGGEVIALDSAGFGTLPNITRAVTIAAIPGENAFINVPASGTGVYILAGAGNDVILRNLQVSGSNLATNTGVLLQSGNLVIENSSFTQLNTGVQIQGTAASKTTIRNSTMTSNVRGLLVYSGSVDIEDASFVNNSTAIQAENQGPDQDPGTGGVTARMTIVRLSDGLLSGNNTAFMMVNPGVGGTRQPGSCNAQNIFIRGDGDGKPNIVGSPTFLAASGATDLNPGCAGPPPSYTIGSYQPQTQNQSVLANQEQREQDPAFVGRLCRTDEGTTESQ